MVINQVQIERIANVAKDYGAKRLILFGSATEMGMEARDIDLACDGVLGWRLYELAGRLEEELGISLDIISLTPPTRFTKYIEAKGKVLL